MLKKIVFIIFLWSCFSAMSQDKIVCRISTSMGDIDVALHQKKAPITVANFLRYVDANLYQNSSFFRVCTPENEAEREIKIQVIQGGDVPENEQFDAIEIETTEKTGILHKNGTLSMARAEPNSATCSFFICIGDQASLDYGGQRNPDGQGFAAFGQVLKGMELVKKIQGEKDDGQYLITPITINSIKRIN